MSWQRFTTRARRLSRRSTLCSFPLFPRKWKRSVDPSIATPGVIQILCGVAAIAGHVRPLWLGFGKGGKGVATAGGVFLALAPVETGLALAAFALTLLASGYVSLGSMIAALLLPVLLFIRDGVSPLFIVCAVIALFVFWTHRANIERLRQGTENRFGRRAASAPHA